MTAAELNATLAALGWSQRTLANKLGVDKMRVNKWAHHREPIPENIVEWLAKLRQAHAEIPAPTGHLIPRIKYDRETRQYVRVFSIKEWDEIQENMNEMSRYDRSK